MMLMVITGCSSTPRGGTGDLVVIDIGHCVGAEGATMRAGIDGKRWTGGALW